MSENKESIAEKETNYLALLSRLNPDYPITIESVMEKTLRAYAKFNHDKGSTAVFQATLDLMSLFLSVGFIEAFMNQDYGQLSFHWSLLSIDSKKYIQYIYEQF